MILVLLLSLVAFADNYGFHVMEDGEIRVEESCLPKETTTPNQERKITINKTYTMVSKKEDVTAEKRYVFHWTNTKRTASCGLDNLKIFFDGKLYPLSRPRYYHHVLSETGDCNYSTPRVEVAFEEDTIQKGFVLGDKFGVLGSEAKKTAEKKFEEAKKKDVDYGYARGYFSYDKEKSAVYVVTDHTEMGTKLILFRLQNKKIEEVDSAYFQPCGS